MRLVIFDPITPRPYSLQTLHSEALGGTEASVVRIAERLDAVVLQHNRSQSDGRYRSIAASVDPTHLVVLREPARALDVFGHYPRAKRFLWMHDLCGPGTEPGKELADHARELARLGVTIICGSNFHAAEARRNFALLPDNDRPNLKCIYLPVDVSDVPGETPAVDTNKLVFFSSPQKGLEYVLHVFSYLHRMNSHLRLYVANPGYRLRAPTNGPGVINLGPVAHHIILEHVRNALCTFSPNYVYPETFGLALAESNALGTPVITHSIGALPEILVGDEQFAMTPRTRVIADRIYRHFPIVRNYGERVLAAMGCFDEYADKVRAWQSGKRPRVCGRVEFSFASVMASWRHVLEA